MMIWWKNRANTGFWHATFSLEVGGTRAPTGAAAPVLIMQAIINRTPSFRVGINRTPTMQAIIDRTPQTRVPRD